jgi:hypothetical protein
MYPLYLSITRSLPPLISSCMSPHLSSELSSCVLATPSPLSLALTFVKIINFCLYPTPLLLPITSQTIPLSSILSQYYSVYSIAPGSPVLFYYCQLYVIVVDPKSHQLYVLLSLSLQTLPHLLHFILWPL